MLFPSSSRRLVSITIYWFSAVISVSHQRFVTLSYFLNRLHESRHRWRENAYKRDTSRKGGNFDGFEINKTVIYFGIPSSPTLHKTFWKQGFFFLSMNPSWGVEGVLTKYLTGSLAYCLLTNFVENGNLWLAALNSWLITIVNYLDYLKSYKRENPYFG